MVVEVEEQKEHEEEGDQPSLFIFQPQQSIGRADTMTGSKPPRMASFSVTEARSSQPLR